MHNDSTKDLYSTYVDAFAAFRMMDNGQYVASSVGVSYYVPNEYMRTGASNYDWAVVVLKDKIIDNANFMRLTVDHKQLDSCNVIGYPEDKGGFEMWESKDTIISYNDYFYNYKSDTAGGNSGGPVVFEGGFIPVAGGIHIAGDSHNKRNVGKIITSDMAQVINRIKESS